MGVKSEHGEKIVDVAFAFLGVCNALFQVAKALVTVTIPVEIPRPGSLIKVEQDFVYMKSSDAPDARTKRFEKGTLFLIVTVETLSKRKKYVMGSDVFKLSVLGSDNRLWHRNVYAHVFSSDFEVQK